MSGLTRKQAKEAKKLYDSMSVEGENKEVEAYYKLLEAQSDRLEQQARRWCTICGRQHSPTCDELKEM